MASSSDQQRQGAGLRTGEITVDSRGGVQGRAGAVITSSTRSSSQTGLQQLQVLNGGKARIYLGSTRPVTQWQFGVGGHGGTNLVNPEARNDGGGAMPAGPGWQAWSSTTLVDTGRGITVRPRWTGGPLVTVELEARVAQQAAYGPDGQTESTEVMTTVQLPLGRWTAVAQRGGQVQQRRRGLLSTEDLSRDDQDVFEMRVSAP
ncbi:hypothetical protein [Aquabacterium sp.]|uniref:hypothetical protein n=1 Tax=Aquabacterium sp. TaxID=1872578 RepID=UPI0019A79142|nr:hypothetical protein [Aquabacterium sp.]MBC7700498.1 hypothetical protein [Aquabacterium sp.]